MKNSYSPTFLVLALILLGGGIIWALNTKSTSEPTPSETPSNQLVDYEIKEVAANLTVPWSIAFTSNERMLITERPGRIRVIDKGNLSPDPIHTLTDVAAQSEAGLMGLTLDPNYSQNKHLYTSYTYLSGGTMYLRVVRFKDEGNAFSNPTTIIDKMPAASNHAGSRIKFGPDKKLYITTGDATERSIAQDLNSLGGKILRINADGTVPSDNPFPNSPIWSYGHRNPQGIDWHPDTNQLFSSEHGPSGFDGPGGGDEINLIQKGANFGWSLVSHERNREGTISPIAVYTPAEAPSGLMVYSGKMFPQYKNNIFVGALRGEGLLRLTLEDGKITNRDKISNVNLGRIREVIEGPDGAIYFSTSNRDGRGSPKSGDDHIYKLTVKN